MTSTSWECKGCAGYTFSFSSLRETLETMLGVYKLTGGEMLVGVGLGSMKGFVGAAAGSRKGLLLNFRFALASGSLSKRRINSSVSSIDVGKEFFDMDIELFGDMHLHSWECREGSLSIGAPSVKGLRNAIVHFEHGSGCGGKYESVRNFDFDVRDLVGFGYAG